MKNKNKILFICDAFWPYIGGAEISAITILSNLSRYNLDVCVLTHKFHQTKSKETYNNMQIYRERLYYPSSINPLIIDYVNRIIFYIISFLIIFKYIKKTKPNMIITQQLISIPAVMASKIFHIPVIVVIHDYWPICYNRNLILKKNNKICINYDSSLSKIIQCVKHDIFIYSKSLFFRNFLIVLYSIFMYMHTLITKEIIKKANTIITVSSYVKDLLILNGFDSNNLHVIYNPISINNKAIKSVAPSLPFILYVGRLDIEKGVQFLLHAMKIVLKKLTNIRLIIVGVGNEKDNLQLLAKELQIENNVVFLGRINNDFLSSLYRRSQAIVVPSIWPEPFGRVVAEAIMFEKPVIATQVGGIPELIIKDTGILVPPKNSKMIAEAILTVMTDKFSFLKPSPICEQFTLNSIGPEFLSIIVSVGSIGK
jgi:glycosyltransferase involved in cell wall biosynthesis